MALVKTSVYQPLITLLYRYLLHAGLAMKKYRLPHTDYRIFLIFIYLFGLSIFAMPVPGSDFGLRDRPG